MENYLDAARTALRTHIKTNNERQRCTLKACLTRDHPNKRKRSRRGSNKMEIETSLPLKPRVHACMATYLRLPQTSQRACNVPLEPEASSPKDRADEIWNRINRYGKVQSVVTLATPGRHLAREVCHQLGQIMHMRNHDVRAAAIAGPRAGHE